MIDHNLYCQAQAVRCLGTMSRERDGALRAWWFARASWWYNRMDGDS